MRHHAHRFHPRPARAHVHASTCAQRPRLTSDAGGVLVNVPFALSTILAIAGGIVQGNAEKRLLKANPGRWPPGVGKVVKDVLKAVRSGELRPCGLRQWLRQRQLADASDDTEAISARSSAVVEMLPA